MRGDEARRLCPQLQLVQVPTAHGKADLTLYRAEGAKVLAIMARYGITERASIDEMYIDCTDEALRRLQATGGAPALPQKLDQIHIAAMVCCFAMVGCCVWGGGGKGERHVASHVISHVISHAVNT